LSRRPSRRVSPRRRRWSSTPRGTGPNDIFAAESARFGHPEHTIAIVTLLGGIYRVAERAGRARVMEWAPTSERVAARVMAQAGVVNRVVADNSLLGEATGFAHRVAGGATRAHAADEALLRTCAVGGVAAADDAMFDIAMPLFETDEVRTGLAAAVDALKAGKPRPVPAFQGN
jgi:enoyl-CoA hydratase/carnithine racemase